MDAMKTVGWMTEAIAKANRSVNFCTSGIMRKVDPGIIVEGVGPIKLPLKPAAAKQLIAACKIAPYGKGTKTVVDRKVRNTFELDSKKFQLADSWSAAIAGVTELVAEQLGLPAGQLEARVYKLLVYERGGFFLPHRDSEKLSRMVATLVVVLPSLFSGGELVVRHESAKQKFRFEDAASGNRPNFVAFYADCEHEVLRVTKGRRVCLTYNLVLKPKRRSKKTKSPLTAEDVLAASMDSWIAARPAEPLVFALEHQYTQRGLAVDLLKGVDRQTAKLVVAAAAKANCCVHLTQVSRHLLQFADDGSYGRDRWSYCNVPAEDLTIGETYEDDLTGDQWKDIQGKRRPFGTIALDPSAIVSSTTLEDWKPSSEDYEGYTGNAGNTLDRWYHRSAIVIWHEDHHFDVIARGGAQRSIELFLSMMNKLEKTPKKRLDKARGDCLRLAQAIIRAWPLRASHGYSLGLREEQPWLDDFAKELLKLEDQSTIADFFSILAQRDRFLQLEKVIPQACRKFGMDAFASQLEELLVTRLGKFDPGPALRDAQWLGSVCCNRKLNAERAGFIQRLCSLAADRFCEGYASEDRFYRRDSALAIKSLLRLVKAFVAVQADQSLAKLIDTVQSSPEPFNLEAAQVPCLVSVVPWSKKREGVVPPLLVGWLADVRQELEAATMERPSPPTDWSRPANVSCNCRFCGQINEFLAAPDSEVTRIAAREDLRSHMIGSIRRYQCDVSYKLERKGRPYSLVLNKTTGSYERTVKRFEINVKLLKSLPSEE